MPVRGPDTAGIRRIETTRLDIKVAIRETTINNLIMAIRVPISTLCRTIAEDQSVFTVNDWICTSTTRLIQWPVAGSESRAQILEVSLAGQKELLAG